MRGRWLRLRRTAREAEGKLRVAQTTEARAALLAQAVFSWGSAAALAPNPRQKAMAWERVACLSAGLAAAGQALKVGAEHEARERHRRALAG